MYFAKLSFSLFLSLLAIGNVSAAGTRGADSIAKDRELFLGVSPHPQNCFDDDIEALNLGTAVQANLQADASAVQCDLDYIRALFPKYFTHDAQILREGQVIFDGLAALMEGPAMGLRGHCLIEAQAFVGVNIIRTEGVYDQFVYQSNVYATPFDDNMMIGRDVYYSFGPSCRPIITAIDIVPAYPLPGSN